MSTAQAGASISAVGFAQTSLGRAAAAASSGLAAGLGRAASCGAGKWLAGFVILASGSDFVTGMNRGRIDMASPYLREILRFIGVTDLRFVLDTSFEAQSKIDALLRSPEVARDLGPEPTEE